MYGPCYFENDNSITQTENGEQYRTILQNVSFPSLQNEDANIWLQKDGPTAHTARETMQLLSQRFLYRIISKTSDFLFRSEQI